MRALLLVAIVACGASNAELRTAKTAVYTGDARKIMDLAEQGAADEHYKIGGVDDGHLSFETAPRFYSSEGDLQSPGAENYTKVDNRSVKVSFIVTIAETSTNQYMVSVTPRTWQYLAGSPQMRELAPDDLGLPPWVHGRADALTVAIYDRARGFVVVPAGPPGAQ